MGSPKMKPGVIGTGKMVEDALFATQPDADEKENRKLFPASHSESHKRESVRERMLPGGIWFLRFSTFKPGVDINI